jgi:hypothetical protein
MFDMGARMRREAGNSVTEPTSAGWYRDPFGRHEKRYHTGTGWTEHVKDRNQAGIDPPRATVSGNPAPLRVTSPTPVARLRPTPVEAPRRTAKVPDHQPDPAQPAAAPKRTGDPALREAAAAKQTTGAPKRTATPRRTGQPAARREPVRTPKPVTATPIRVARPPATPAATAPAFARSADTETTVPRTLHKRPPSSYLKPAPAPATPLPVETHRPRWPWVVVSIFVLLAIILATGIGLIGDGATEPRTVAPPPLPKRAAHTLTPAEFEIVTVGTSRAKVVDGLDTLPAPPAEYRKIFPGAKVDPACIYYYAKTNAGSYTLCFGNDKNVISKSTVKHRRVASR